MKKLIELVKKRHREDKSHIELTYVTHFYCNQKNINSITDLLKKYETYSRNLIEKIEFIIVDDCSPLEYEIPDLNLNYRWLKITTDIQWNQGGARNLGVTYAKSDKIIMSDLDHELPEHTLDYLVKHRNPGRKFYKLHRKHNDGSFYKGHSNLFFMSRSRFLRFHGYDEEFCGHYGAEDYRFVKYHKYHGSKQGYLPKKIWCSKRQLDFKNSNHSLSRDLSYNTPVDIRKKEECENFGLEYGHSRLFLNFDWITLSKKNIRPDEIPVIRRYWRPLWWFRWLIPFLSR